MCALTKLFLINQRLLHKHRHGRQNYLLFCSCQVPLPAPWCINGGVRLGEPKQTEPGVPSSTGASFPGSHLPWGGISGSEPVWPWLPPDLTRARLQGVPGWALNQPRTSEYEGGTANPPWAASLGKGRSQDDKCAPGDGYPGLFCELLIACQCWSPSRARGGSSSCLVANCCVCSLVASRQSWHAKSRICWREGRPPFHPYGLGRQ